MLAVGLATQLNVLPPRKRANPSALGPASTRKPCIDVPWVDAVTKKPRALSPLGAIATLVDDYPEYTSQAEELRDARVVPQ